MTEPNELTPKVHHPIDCVGCGYKIFVRRNGTIVAHYASEGNRCACSETLSAQCCESGRFGDGHECRKQPGAYLAATALPVECPSCLARRGWNCHHVPTSNEGVCGICTALPTEMEERMAAVRKANTRVGDYSVGTEEIDWLLDTIRTLQGQLGEARRQVDEWCMSHNRVDAELSRLRAENEAAKLHQQQTDLRISRQREEIKAMNVAVEATFKRMNLFRVWWNALRAENEGLRKALNNCRMVGAREIRRHDVGKSSKILTLAAWKHILRFCEGAGVTGSVLREELGAALNAGEAPGAV
jgi:hypothetical protein